MSLKCEIEQNRFVPYIYAYPTSRALGKIEHVATNVFEFTKNVNVFIYIPFCQQKCTWCPYLTFIGHKGDIQDRYVESLIKEIYHSRHILEKSNIVTINFGGGTPSLLSEKQFANIMLALKSCNKNALQADEISIEATPESIQSGKLKDFAAYGLNRVSAGVESFNNNEIALSGRHNSSMLSKEKILLLKSTGLRNICVDLMYGLQNQTLESWEHSVASLIQLYPNTIELYAVADTPFTRFSSQERVVMSPRQKKDAYNTARQMCLDAGYVQDCHLRFISSEDGGYRQQKNIFSGQSLIGFGVGARSYSKRYHYRNVYDAINPKESIHSYIRNLEDNKSSITSLYELSDDDLMRQYVIYNLEHLHTKVFQEKFGVSYEQRFEEEYAAMLDNNLCFVENDVIYLNFKGLAHRDLISSHFFSDKMKELESFHR